MLVPVIKIGNSHGIRLSKALLRQYDIRENVEIILHPDSITITPVRQEPKPRRGWSKAFKQMHDNGDDTLYLPDIFDDEEWA